MTTPRVNEIAPRLEPTMHDGFIDDLAPRRLRAPGAPAHDPATARPT